MKKNNLTALLAITVLSSFLVNCGRDKSQPNIEIIQNFMESPAIKAQEYDEDSPQHRGMRNPPEHTVPVGFTPYKYGDDVAWAEKDHKNPLAGNDSQEILMTGQKYFETYCMVCHGQNGEGEGSMPVATKMPRKPPALTAQNARNMTDGRIYHIITKGQGVMGGYAGQIPQEYRWQIVNYVRYLQKEHKQ